VKLKAVCHRCGEPAMYTQRLVDGKPAPFSGETVVIGGLDSYQARCRGCFKPG
jgi:thymidine kinase